MGWAGHVVYMGEKEVIQGFGKKNLKDLVVGGRIILKWILKNRTRGSRRFGSAEAQVAGFVHTVMVFDSHKMREISWWRTWFLKRGAAASSSYSVVLVRMWHTERARNVKTSICSYPVICYSVRVWFKCIQSIHLNVYKVCILLPFLWLTFLFPSSVSNPAIQ